MDFRQGNRGGAKLKRRHIRRLQGFCYDTRIFCPPSQKGFTVPPICANGFFRKVYVCNLLICMVALQGLEPRTRGL
uniref:Uncharacterized protein n=1 Tax=mine drainage metagenome TaxID=410659 RepID=E6QF85_9ZZZZ